MKRTYLFVPGTMPERMKKALNSGADAVIIDLEDAVAAPDKEKARACSAAFLQERTEGAKVYVRINDVLSPYWREDVRMAAQCGADGLMIPKAEHPAGVRVVCGEASGLLSVKKNGGPFEIIPLIETAAGLHFAYDIACSHPMIARLAFGSIDYTLDVGSMLTDTGDELLYAKSQIVNASRAAGIGAPVDAVYPNLDDETGLHADALRGRRFGFAGKMAVHPKQLPAIRGAFAPSSAEVAEAKEQMAAFEKALAEGKGAVAAGSMLVDYPVYKKAKELLASIPLKEADI